MRELNTTEQNHTKHIIWRLDRKLCSIMKFPSSVPLIHRLKLFDIWVSKCWFEGFPNRFPTNHVFYLPFQVTLMCFCWWLYLKCRSSSLFLRHFRRLPSDQIIVMICCPGICFGLFLKKCIRLNGALTLCPWTMRLWEKWDDASLGWSIPGIMRPQVDTSLGRFVPGRLVTMSPFFGTYHPSPFWTSWTSFRDATSGHRLNFFPRGLAQNDGNGPPQAFNFSVLVLISKTTFEQHSFAHGFLFAL
jgi:hypothetical protein